MNPLLTLALMWTALVLLAYFVTLGLFQLIKRIAEQGGQALKSLFLLIAFIGLAYLGINHDKSDTYLQDIKDWKNELVQDHTIPVSS